VVRDEKDILTLPLAINKNILNLNKKMQNNVIVIVISTV
jgi:hypothetical protein